MKKEKEVVENSQENEVIKNKVKFSEKMALKFKKLFIVDDNLSVITTFLTVV